jgi:hypothetical protein
MVSAVRARIFGSATSASQPKSSTGSGENLDAVKVRGPTCEVRGQRYETSFEPREIAGADLKPECGLVQGELLAKASPAER